MREDLSRISIRIIDITSFNGALFEDIDNAKVVVLIFFSFLNSKRVKLFEHQKHTNALRRGVRGVVTRSVRESKDGISGSKKHSEAAKIPREASIRVIKINGLHSKAMIIDEKILCLGLIRPPAYYLSSTTRQIT